MNYNNGNNLNWYNNYLNSNSNLSYNNNNNNNYKFIPSDKIQFDYNNLYNKNNFKNLEKSKSESDEYEETEELDSSNNSNNSDDSSENSDIKENEDCENYEEKEISNDDKNLFYIKFSKVIEKNKQINNSLKNLEGKLGKIFKNFNDASPYYNKLQSSYFSKKYEDNIILKDNINPNQSMISDYKSSYSSNKKLDLDYFKKLFSQNETNTNNIHNNYKR